MFEILPAGGLGKVEVSRQESIGFITVNQEFHGRKVRVLEKNGNGQLWLSELLVNNVYFTMDQWTVL